MLDNCDDGILTCFLQLKREIETMAGNYSTNILGGLSACVNGQDECRNEEEALRLKFGALIAILLASICGVVLPLIAKSLKVMHTDGTAFVVAKALAAGVILATGFVHILPDAMENLTSDCLPKHPWKEFPFAGFVAMLAALATLAIDFAGTEFFERSHARKAGQTHIDPLVNGEENMVLDNEIIKLKEDGNVHQEHMHIVGMRAHAASHSHSHPEGHHACVDMSHNHAHGHFGHSSLGNGEGEMANARHIVISQVLELGVITHSIIIGVSLGVSQSPCTIRPLLAALSFHQFFEGFALGGCIYQAGFKMTSAAIMAICFAITTPIGIAIGIGVSENYNANSPRAIIVEGLFDSVSAGILIYMALVDLIAADFLSKRMRCDHRLQIISFMFLLLGASAMSLLALWA